MKTKTIALSLFSATAIGVLLYPQIRDAIAIQPPVKPPVHTTNIVKQTQQPKVEVVFALDTTGSMGGLIQAAKEKIWSIATTLAQGDPAPEIRMGLVAYRDRGDAYVTKVFDLSSDLDTMYGELMEFKAQGGGDGPESVNQALHDAVHRISWSQDANTYRVVFLVGDAPPHMDYQDDVKYPVTIREARQRGIVINGLQAGRNGGTESDWRKIASLGGGTYLNVESSGNAVAVATPYDERLAALSKELDQTRMYYGSDREREIAQRKIEATSKLHAKASVESQARRATFNASPSGAKNLLGDSELVDAVVGGRVDLNEIDKDLLPEPLQAMSPAEQKAVIAEKAKKRDKLRQEVARLAESRESFIAKKVEEEGGAKDSFDDKIYRAVKEQAAGAGLKYEAAAPSY